MPVASELDATADGLFGFSYLHVDKPSETVPRRLSSVRAAGVVCLHGFQGAPRLPIAGVRGRACGRYPDHNWDVRTSDDRSGTIQLDRFRADTRLFSPPRG